MVSESPAEPLGSHLPLNPLVLEILLLRTSGEGHGYGILKEIEAFRSFPSTVPASTIYRTLHRLRDQDIVQEMRQETQAREGDTGARRRRYRLTERGMDLVKAELTRLDRVRARASARGLAP